MAAGRPTPGPPSPEGTAAFYDDLAATYDRLFPDWDAAVREQGAALDRLLGSRLGRGPHRVLDATCGIGTQALGLADLGHDVVGTDLSGRALRRTSVEALRRGLTLPVLVADVRRLPVADGAVDAALSVDALAHLLSLDEATRALCELARVVRRDGVVVVSVRDYEAPRRDRLPGTLPQVHRSPAGMTIAFQVWDWHDDGARYDLTHVVLTSGAATGGGWTVTSRAATLRAVVRDELLEVADAAGLGDVEWRTPAETGFFQPVLVGRVTGLPRDGRCG